MSTVRQVIPGDVVFSTTRTIARFYLLRPDRELVRAVMYVLGCYAQVHDIDLYAACLMSTHLHLVYRDREGNGPAFLQDAHRCIANVVKALRGWRGAVFAERPNETRLETTEAIAKEVGYVMANPVAAGGVRYARDWPGLRTRLSDIGRRGVEVERPKLYFDPEGKMPERVTLRFELPEALVAKYGEAGTRTRLEESFERQEKKARAEIRAKGCHYLGAQRCLRISPYRRAKAYEVFGSLNPNFATGKAGREAFEQAVHKHRTFQQQYGQRLERWREGDRTSPWPLGTYRMLRLHRVAIGTGPPAPS